MLLNTRNYKNLGSPLDNYEVARYKQWQGLSFSSAATQTESIGVPQDSVLIQPVRTYTRKQITADPNVIQLISWAPFINANLKIAIKGVTNENVEFRGARIVERITNYKIRDRKNRIYLLQGPLSEDVVLPNYVREKFKNGFSKDWLEVGSIWIEYKTTEQPEIFRWPQEVTACAIEHAYSEHSKNSNEIAENQYGNKIEDSNEDLQSPKEKILRHKISNCLNELQMSDFKANSKKNQITLKTLQKLKIMMEKLHVSLADLLMDMNEMIDNFSDVTMSNHNTNSLKSKSTTAAVQCDLENIPENISSSNSNHIGSSNASTQYDVKDIITVNNTPSEKFPAPQISNKCIKKDRPLYGRVAKNYKYTESIKQQKSQLIRQTLQEISTNCIKNGLDQNKRKNKTNDKRSQISPTSNRTYVVLDDSDSNSYHSESIVSAKSYKANYETFQK